MTDLIAEVVALVGDYTYAVGSAFVFGILAIFYGYGFKIIGLIVSTAANLIMKVSTSQAVREFTDFNKLPTNPRASTLMAHLANAVARCTRIRGYLDIRRLKKAAREGPYALQLLIEELYDVDFQRWHLIIINAMVQVDMLEEAVHRLIHRWRWQVDDATSILDKDIQQREPRLARQRVRWNKAIEVLKRTRTLKSFWRQLAIVRTHRRCWYTLSRQQKRQIRKCKRITRRLERNCNIELKPYLWQLHDFEKVHLEGTVPTFQADWASIQQTVETGRTLARFMDPKNRKMQEIRKLLKLEHLPYDLADMRHMMFSDLKGRVGVNPNWHDEDLFETWLRVYYHDLGAEKCPVEVLPEMGSQSFHLWVCQLVPPGEKGLAHQQYGHLGQQGTMGWLMPPPPNAKTAPVEVAA